MPLFCTELALKGCVGEVVGGMLKIAEGSAVARSEVCSRSRERWKKPLTRRVITHAAAEASFHYYRRTRNDELMASGY
jgi:hypothetical protein